MRAIGPDLRDYTQWMRECAPIGERKLTTKEHSEARSSARAPYAKLLIWLHTTPNRLCVAAEIWSNEPASAEAESKPRSTTAPKYSCRNFSTRETPQMGVDRRGTRAELDASSPIGGGTSKVA